MRIRLVLWSSLAALLVVAAGVAFTYFLVGRQLVADLREDLSTELTRFEESLPAVEGQQRLLEHTRDYLGSAEFLGRRGMVLSLIAPGGASISNSGEVDLQDFALTERLLEGEAGEIGRIRAAGEEYLVAGRPVMLQGRTLGAVVVAAPLEPVRSIQREVLGVLLFAGLVVLVLVTAGSWILTGRALIPVRRMTRTASEITRHDLSRRIDYRGPPDEVGGLAATLNDMLDRLERAFGAQDRFISDVSHELRTPLTIIKGHLQLLQEQEEPDWDEVRREHALVLEQLDRLNRMVEELLALARLQRGDVLDWSEVDPAELVRTLAEHGRHLADRVWVVEEEGDSGCIEADKDRLTQALLNLMQNAVRHTSPGDEIALGYSAADSVSESGPTVRFWVRDQGAGMPPEVRRQVTERFYRAPGTEGSALGLGLAIVKGIAEAHGGHLEIESEPGRGSCVTLVVPAYGVGRTGNGLQDRD
ncbi:MAG: hypothetical protein Kow00129_16590 [Thermoleophilia bacterium]